MISEMVPERLKPKADLEKEILNRADPRFYLSIFFAAVWGFLPDARATYSILGFDPETGEIGGRFNPAFPRSPWCFMDGGKWECWRYREGPGRVMGQTG